MSKVLIFPGAFQLVRNYGGYEGIEIWEKGSCENAGHTECLIGHSLGASYALSIYAHSKDKKFILVNPVVGKINPARLFFRWIGFLCGEGIDPEKLVPRSDWFYCFKEILELLKVDVLGILENLPKENIFVIRGKSDEFLCDGQAARIIKERGINMIEVEAGHDWNGKIASAVEEILSKI
jgi:hypothetical protein